MQEKYLPIFLPDTIEDAPGGRDKIGYQPFALTMMTGLEIGPTGLAAFR